MIAALAESLIINALSWIVCVLVLNLGMSYFAPGESVNLWWLTTCSGVIFLKDLYYA